MPIHQTSGMTSTEQCESNAQHEDMHTHTQLYIWKHTVDGLFPNACVCADIFKKAVEREAEKRTSIKREREANFMPGKILTHFKSIGVNCIEIVNHT